MAGSVYGAGVILLRTPAGSFLFEVSLIVNKLCERKFQAP
jgi:hypothetical protein